MTATIEAKNILIRDLWKHPQFLEALARWKQDFDIKANTDTVITAVVKGLEFKESYYQAKERANKAERELMHLKQLMRQKTELDWQIASVISE